MKLTKRSIDAIKIDASREHVFWDDDLPGFGLRVKATGAKSFLVQYRNRHGRSRRLTLGKFGVITPEQARTAAKIALGSVAAGGDPVEAKAAERGAMPMSDLCKEYLEKAEDGKLVTRRGKTKKKSTIYTDKGRIERHIIPLLGRRSVKEITKADITKFLADVISGKTKANVKTGKRGRAVVKGGRGTGARTLGLLGGIFSYAVSQGYRPDNPCVGVVRPADNKRKFRLDEAGYRILENASPRRRRRTSRGKQFFPSGRWRLLVVAAARSRVSGGPRLMHEVVRSGLATARQTKARGRLATPPLKFSEQR